MATSLAWTAVAKTDMVSFMTDKVYMKFGNEDTVFNAWKTWADASGNSFEKAAATKFSGKTIDFIISNSWLAGWPTPDPANNFYEFVTKWSGGCLEDYSSGMGGFCLLEDNDTAFYDCGNIDCQYAADGSLKATACTEAPANCLSPAPKAGSDDAKRCAKKTSTAMILCGAGQAAAGSTVWPMPAFNAAAGDGTGSPPTGAASACTALTGASGFEKIMEDDKGAPVNVYWDRKFTADIEKTDGTGEVYYQDSTRKTMFYRLAKADFATFEKAWDNTDFQCDKGTATSGSAALNKQDGRAYQMSIRDKRVNEQDPEMLEYFDYPKCAAVSGNDWNCQMYLPLKDKQTPGYARFEQPGVVSGYYVASYFPGVKEIALAKSTQVNKVAAGDLALTAASALAVTFASILF